MDIRKLRTSTRRFDRLFSLAGLLLLTQACADDDGNNESDSHGDEHAESSDASTTTGTTTGIGTTETGPATTGTTTGDTTGPGDSSESSGSSESGDLDPKTQFEASLQQALEDAVASPLVSSAFLRVDSPKGSWQGAVGNTEVEGGSPVAAGDAFVLHSVTKTMTAAAALKAVEAGLLGLDDAIAPHVDAELMQDLHIFEEVDYSDELTLRQLLSHRTGLADYFFDGAERPDEFPPFMKLMFENPEHEWRPTEIIEWEKENLSPFFAPEQGYHYSDTNYVLVGLALEKIYEMTLPEVFHQELFAPLGMEHTWMLHEEDPKLPEGGQLSHVYLQGIDLATMPAMRADWAGGGLVSTTDDLSTFLQSIQGGKLFDEANTLAEMRDFQAVDEGEAYGLGLARYGDDMIALEGHGGFGGAFMFYVPQLDSYFSGTVNTGDIEPELLGEAITATYIYMLSGL